MEAKEIIYQIIKKNNQDLFSEKLDVECKFENQKITIEFGFLHNKKLVVIEHSETETEYVLEHRAFDRLLKAIIKKSIT